MWQLSSCGCKCNKTCKIDHYLDIKNKKKKKFLIGKLVLERADEILETIETSFDDKKATYEKNYCLIHTISLLVI